MPVKVAHDILDESKQRSADVTSVPTEEELSFDSFMLSKPVLNGLRKAGFLKPSPIQHMAIPVGRCGVDMIVQAKSGTGKTCVFVVVALEMVVPSSSATQVIMIAPTREIANQIKQAMSSIAQSITPKLAIRCFTGGESTEVDRRNCQGCQVAIGTPGRLTALVQDGSLSLDRVRLLVLDEADHLMDDSFQENINWLYSKSPKSKQVVVLSATYPEKLDTILSQYMRTPTHVRLDRDDVQLLGIKQYARECGYTPNPMVCKLEALNKLLLNTEFSQCLVFSNFKDRAQSVQDFLKEKEWPSMLMSAKLAQKDRNAVMKKLKAYTARIVVSTDLTSRGIDAENVNLVVNFDIPPDVETYLHRIGRAGRYGSFGAAVSLFVNGPETTRYQSIVEQGNLRLKELPSEFAADICSDMKFWEDCNPLAFREPQMVRSVDNDRPITSVDHDQCGLEVEDVESDGDKVYSKRTMLANTTGFEDLLEGLLEVSDVIQEEVIVKTPHFSNADALSALAMERPPPGRRKKWNKGKQGAGNPKQAGNPRQWGASGSWDRKPKDSGPETEEPGTSGSGDVDNDERTTSPDTRARFLAKLEALEAQMNGATASKTPPPESEGIGTSSETEVMGKEPCPSTVVPDTAEADVVQSTTSESQDNAHPALPADIDGGGGSFLLGDGLPSKPLSYFLLPDADDAEDDSGSDSVPHGSDTAVETAPPDGNVIPGTGDIEPAPLAGETGAPGDIEQPLPAGGTGAPGPRVARSITSYADCGARLSYNTDEMLGLSGLNTSKSTFMTKLRARMVLSGLFDIIRPDVVPGLLSPCETDTSMSMDESFLDHEEHLKLEPLPVIAEAIDKGESIDRSKDGKGSPDRSEGVASDGSTRDRIYSYSADEMQELNGEHKLRYRTQSSLNRMRIFRRKKKRDVRETDSDGSLTDVRRPANPNRDKGKAANQSRDTKLSDTNWRVLKPNVSDAEADAEEEASARHRIYSKSDMESLRSDPEADYVPWHINAGDELLRNTEDLTPVYGGHGPGWQPRSRPVPVTGSFFPVGPISSPNESTDATSNRPIRSGLHAVGRGRKPPTPPNVVPEVAGDTERTVPAPVAHFPSGLHALGRGKPVRRPGTTEQLQFPGSPASCDSPMPPTSPIGSHPSEPFWMAPNDPATSPRPPPGFEAENAPPGFESVSEMAPIDLGTPQAGLAGANTGSFLMTDGIPMKPLSYMTLPGRDSTGTSPSPEPDLDPVSKPIPKPSGVRFKPPLQAHLHAAVPAYGVPATRFTVPTVPRPATFENPLALPKYTRAPFFDPKKTRPTPKSDVFSQIHSALTSENQPATLSQDDISEYRVLEDSEPLVVPDLNTSGDSQAPEPALPGHMSQKREHESNDSLETVSTVQEPAKPKHSPPEKPPDKREKSRLVAFDFPKPNSPQKKDTPTTALENMFANVAAKYQASMGSAGHRFEEPRVPEKSDKTAKWTVENIPKLNEGGRQLVSYAADIFSSSAVDVDSCSEVLGQPVSAVPNTDRDKGRQPPVTIMQRGASDQPVNARHQQNKDPRGGPKSYSVAAGADPVPTPASTDVRFAKPAFGAPAPKKSGFWDDVYKKRRAVTHIYNREKMLQVESSNKTTWSHVVGRIPKQIYTKYRDPLAPRPEGLVVEEEPPEPEPLYTTLPSPRQGPFAAELPQELASYLRDFWASGNPKNMELTNRVAELAPAIGEFNQKIDAEMNYRVAEAEFRLLNGLPPVEGDGEDDGSAGNVISLDDLVKTFEEKATLVSHVDLHTVAEKGTDAEPLKAADNDTNDTDKNETAIQTDLVETAIKNDENAALAAGLDDKAENAGDSGENASDNHSTTRSTKGSLEGAKSEGDVHVALQRDREQHREAAQFHGRPRRTSSRGSSSPDGRFNDREWGKWGAQPHSYHRGSHQGHRGPQRSGTPPGPSMTQDGNQWRGYMGALHQWNRSSRRPQGPPRGKRDDDRYFRGRPRAYGPVGSYGNYMDFMKK